MNKILLFALVAFGLATLVMLAYTPSASAAPAFEDPQICLNGKLLMVEPTNAPIEAWLDVGPGVHVDFNVANCGGDPNLPIFAANHVLHANIGNWATLAVKTRKHTDVSVLWDGNTYTFNSGRNNWIFVSQRVN